MPSIRAALIWAVVAGAIVVSLALAATSPLLAWRGPIYVVAGFAGVVALALVLLQPLLAAGYLPGLPVPRGRRVHRWVGPALVGAIIIHVAGLWLTSPPDVVDALLFNSPTPFSAWGVVAMWAAFAAALLAALRRPLRIRPRAWRLGHTGLVVLVVLGGVVHALLIEGTMGSVSKLVLCALVVSATAVALFDLRAWMLLTRRKPQDRRL
ncbi:ferric reductase-like transmembrane domain-containing protein [Bosea sp. NBC_00550]|uniref:ferric reductase-like transmembrane domain-containing protein n=1 Tax=Bosea sp. NBC_00550 TaxID=2969621 RepID=UPI00222EAE72|nr:ferric reductase-like transmembrane domain-containing protein [Bosea sp. NBC_00550]UZF95273.1 ferric reductase-like transmembrane domain-containing protein [Bosea sp. NBC_00550]